MRSTARPPAPRPMRAPSYAAAATGALLTGCAATDGVATDIAWSGYVLDGPPGGDAAVVPGAAIAAQRMDGSERVQAAQPYADFPGYLEMVVAPEQPYALRVDGPGLQPTVWRATSPSRSAQWITGALFARPADEVAAGVEALFGAEAAQRLISGATAALWGQPWDPDAWRGASVSAADTSGIRPPIRVLTLVEGGYADAGPDDPVDLVIAADLAPGAVDLTVSTDDGLTIDRWPLRGGELGALDFFALASE